MGGFIILFGIALFKGIYGKNESCQDPATYGCEDPPPEFHQSLKDSAPDAEFLTRFCPYVKNVTSCNVDYAEACNKMRRYSQTVSSYNLTVELCDETSDLRKAYERHIDCMWPLRYRDRTPCKDRIKARVLLYVDYRARQGNIYKGVAEAAILKQYLITRCYASVVQESCGEEARATFWEMAMRFDPVYTQEQTRDAVEKYDDMLNDQPRFQTGINTNYASCQDPAVHECEDLPPEFHQSLNDSAPDAEFLTRFCPSVRNVISCYADNAQTCGKMRAYSQAVSTYNLTVELCDETSDLHKAYERHVECMWPIRHRDVTPCRERIKTQILLYVYYRARIKQDVYKGIAESHILKQYLIIRCYASEVQESCGEEAKATFWEMALRFYPEYPQEQMREVVQKYQDMLNEQPGNATVSDAANLLQR